jgi:hypothetical protein
MGDGAFTVVFQQLEVMRDNARHRILKARFNDPPVVPLFEEALLVFSLCF